MDKPEYKVPSLAEINAIPHNGLTMVSTFSGAGGSCLGFKMAGFKVAWASEFVAAARSTYAANHPNTILDDRDIRSVTAEEILQAVGLQPGQLDVFEGSPPCASFSTAGKRAKGWGKVRKYSDVEQRSDDLFFEYARLLRGLKPRVFVAENVSGLVKGVAKGYFLEILRELKSCGYRVECRILDAQWLGVPQSRQRAIFVGVRDDLGVDPVFPKPLSYRYSVREACPWIDGRAIHDTGGQPQYSTGDVTDKPCAAVTTQQNLYVHGDAKIVAVSGFSKGDSKSLDDPAPTIMAGGLAGSSRDQILLQDAGMPPDLAPCLASEWDKLAPGVWSEKYQAFIKAHPDKPCPTVTTSAGGGSVAHPFQRRKFSILELKRICSFPDDYTFVGTFAQQWERLGRAVPPVMMAAVASQVRDLLKGIR